MATNNNAGNDRSCRTQDSNDVAVGNAACDPSFGNCNGSSAASSSLYADTIVLKPPPASSSATAARTGISNSQQLPSPVEFYNKFVKQRRPVLLKHGAACSHVLTPKLFCLLGADHDGHDRPPANGNVSNGVSVLSKLCSIVGRNTLVQVNEARIDTKGTTTTTTTTEQQQPQQSCFSPMHSRIVEMTFGDFCDALMPSHDRTSTSSEHDEHTKSGEDTAAASSLSSSSPLRYYLTTQTLGVDEEGRPLLYTTPIKELVHAHYMDDCFRPNLLGNLVPMTYNLWIGGGGSSSSSSSSGGQQCNNGSSNSNKDSKSRSSSSPSPSSGLHHDYHDNLYCVLQGHKTFRIAPPKCVHLFRMKGTLHTLHDNGRIVYKEQVQGGSSDNGDGDNDDDMMMIRPDGALVQVERIMQLQQRRQEVEEQLTAVATAKATTTRNEQLQEQLETELDAIEEELLDIEINNGGRHAAAAHDADASSTAKQEEDETLFFGTNANKYQYIDDNSSSGEDIDDDDDDDEPCSKRAKTSHAQNDQGESDNDDGESVPLNFVMEETKDAQAQFQTLELHKGDVLYLPAGWFHEVSSNGSNNDDNGLHIAFNYWMHPPDVGKDVSFEKPYLSEFWQEDWESRRESLKRDQEIE